MNSATAAIATPIQISVQRSLLAAEALVMAGVTDEPSSADTVLGVTVASAMYVLEDPVVVVTPETPPAFAMRKRTIRGALVSARVALLAYAGIVSLGFWFRLR